MSRPKLPFPLTRPQRKVFRDTHRFRVLVAGRRFGKTFLAGPELLRMAWGPDREAWYIAPTYKQAKMVAWRPLKRLLAPYAAKKPNESELSIDLRWGARICLKGAENYDALRGPGLNGVVFDEYADINPLAWTEVVRPMLADRKGSALWIGTPEGYNHFYDLWAEAKTKPGWAAFQFTTEQGGNVSRQEIEDARHDLDERTFRQEFQASFETFEGRAYYCFDRNLNVRPLRYDPKLPLVWSLDFNVDPATSVIGQLREDPLDPFTGKQNRVFHVLDELYLRNTSTPEHCEDFGEKIRPYVKSGQPITVQVYGDASGIKRSSAAAGARSDWDAIQSWFARNPDVRLVKKWGPSNPAVKDRIAAVNAAFCNALGERKCFLDPKCRHLREDLEKVAYKSGTTFGLDPGSEKMLTHISDALGYWIDSEAGIRQPGGPRSTRIV